MVFDLTILSFGVIATEALTAIEKKNKIKKNKIFKIAIIERDINNIPGGVAYSKINSKFGYFNNPLRLSHPNFIKWIKNKKNLYKLISFIKKNPNYRLNRWLEKNSKNFFKKSIYNEIYFPRLVYSFYLEDKIRNFMKIHKKKNILIDFYRGEINQIKKNKQIHVTSLNPMCQFKINTKSKAIKFHITKKYKNNIITKNLIVGNGLTPPKKITEINKSINSNYIWDFYAEGGTGNLLKKINLELKKKNNLIISFIGNKAGLLETMKELEYLILSKKKNIKLLTISKNPLTLEKAEISTNHTKFKLKIFINKNIKKISSAKQIFINLKKEFKFAISNGFNKYDVWTHILKKNILSKCLAKLNMKEKEKYNLSIFPKIRGMTRYTYPETIIAKENLEKKGFLKFVKSKVSSIKKEKEFITIKTNTRKEIKSHIVVNVSGPINLKEIKKESGFISSLKKISKNFNQRGFTTDKYFMLKESIFLPGNLSNNFNPFRKTLIKAVTNNTYKVVKFILRKEFV